MSSLWKSAWVYKVVAGVVGVVVVGIALSSLVLPVTQTSRSVEVPVVVRADKSDDYVKAPSTAAMFPAEGEDYLAYIWVRPSSFPHGRTRMVFLLSYDAESVERRGIGLSFSRVGTHIHPELYWKGSSRDGGWKVFPEIELVPRVWVLLAVSVRVGGLLGMHAVVRYDPKVGTQQLLGGYDVKALGDPVSSSPLLLGAPPEGTFRGDVGPFGVITGPQLNQHLDAILRGIDAAPSQKPVLPRNYHLRLFIPNRDQKTWIGWRPSHE